MILKIITMLLIININLEYKKINIKKWIKNMKDILII